MHNLIEAQHQLELLKNKNFLISDFMFARRLTCWRSKLQRRRKDPRVGTARELACAIFWPHPSLPAAFACLNTHCLLRIYALGDVTTVYHAHVVPITRQDLMGGVLMYLAHPFWKLSSYAYGTTVAMVHSAGSLGSHSEPRPLWFKL